MHDGAANAVETEPPAGVLIDIPSGSVTRGLIGARNLVLAAARRDHRGRFDVIADGGCGKTRLLNELAESLRDLGYVALFITMSPQRMDGRRLTEADLMRGDEVTYHQIIADLVSDISTAYANPARKGREPLSAAAGWRIEQRMLAARTALPEPPVSASTATAGRDAYAAGRDMYIAMHMSEADLLRARWTASLDAFVASVHELAGHCQVAILVDDLHLVLGTGAGRWLLGALDQLPGILTVHARRPDPARDVLGRAQVVRLTPMSREEAKAYTRKELPGWSPVEAEELGSMVYKLTGGYPVWVRTCCQMIAAETGQGVPPDQVKERLLDAGASLSSVDLTARFGRFVDDYCTGLLGVAVQVFDLLTVLRRVSRKSLASLLAARGLDSSDCGRLFDWLKASAFMTAIDDGGSTDSGEPPDIRLHDVIRHQAERNLRRHALTRYRELHASAERYYRARLNFDQEPEEDVSPLQYCVYYEEPDWQASSLEWLHHAGQVDDEEFPLARRAMIRLFLDAFWWNDTDFPVPNDFHYSRALLADYRALPRRRSGDQWLRYLEELRESYVADVPNRGPGRDSERWRRTEDALRGLWHFLRLDRRKIPGDHDLRRIKIMLSYFRGDAEYFGGTGDTQSRDSAAAWYTEAEEAAALDEADDWLTNWMLYAKASVYVTSDPAKARHLASALPQRIDDQEDHALRVFLIWLYADLAWMTGDKALALDIYARAVLHAFVYHIRQERMPMNPSRYTVEFYQMCLDGTRRRLAEAREEGLGEIARVAAGRMNCLFAPYWTRVGRVPDNPEGFPAQPAPADLGTVNSQFAETVLWALDAMSARLEEPLDGPLLFD